MADSAVQESRRPLPVANPAFSFCLSLYSSLIRKVNLLFPLYCCLFSPMSKAHIPDLTGHACTVIFLFDLFDGFQRQVLQVLQLISGIFNFQDQAGTSPFSGIQQDISSSSATLPIAFHLVSFTQKYAHSKNHHVVAVFIFQIVIRGDFQRDPFVFSGKGSVIA